MSLAPVSSKPSLAQLGGWRGLLVRPGLVLATLFGGAHIGADAAGNQYFERKAAGRRQETATGARLRRWVVYAGAPDASAIGPEWHAWLHYITAAPLPATNRKPWQQPHQPNLTGTVAGYRPAGHDYEGGQRAAASADYQSWSPDL